jgi:L-lactate dehydrogenase
MSVKRICESIVRDEKSILSVSSLQKGDYPLDGVALSMPAIVGRHGVEALVPIELSTKEQEDLCKSAEALRKVICDVSNEEERY